MECPIEGADVVSDAEDNWVWVVVNFLSSKGDKSCTVVEDDGNILQTIDGDKSLVGVVFEVQERTLHNLFLKCKMPPEFQGD